MESGGIQVQTNSNSPYGSAFWGLWEAQPKMFLNCVIGLCDSKLCPLRGHFLSYQTRRWLKSHQLSPWCWDKKIGPIVKTFPTGRTQDVWNHLLNTVGTWPGWGLFTILLQKNLACKWCLPLHVCSESGKTILREDIKQDPEFTYPNFPKVVQSWSHLGVIYTGIERLTETSEENMI